MRHAKPCVTWLGTVGCPVISPVPEIFIDFPLPNGTIDHVAKENLWYCSSDVGRVKLFSLAVEDGEAKLFLGALRQIGRFQDIFINQNFVEMTVLTLELVPSLPSSPKGPSFPVDASRDAEKWLGRLALSNTVFFVDAMHNDLCQSPRTFFVLVTFYSHSEWHELTSVAVAI